MVCRLFQEASLISAWSCGPLPSAALPVHICWPRHFCHAGLGSPMGVGLFLPRMNVQWFVHPSFSPYSVPATHEALFYVPSTASMGE